MFKSDVLCVGSATVDNMLTMGQPFSSLKLGDKVLVKSTKTHTGGGATNSACALAKLGLKVKILTKLGDDHNAELILKELKQNHILNVCSCRSKKNTDTATIISSTKEKDRLILVHKGASTEISLCSHHKQNFRVKWIYLASLMGHSFSTAKEIARQAQHKKINLLFNPSLYLAQKGRNYLAPVLRATTILVLNKEEMQSLLNTKEKESFSLLQKAKSLGPKTIVITDGPKKMVAWHENKIYSLIPPDVPIVHTTGAGDAFTSGLLYGLIKNYKFEDALRLGQVNSSSVIQHYGAKKGLLNEKQALNLMKRSKIKVIIKNIDV
ncbi:carbohydrate kinase family protein [Candidatus Woesearchaeota archaeon]|nr:carbohydrate kinase family protein [Candidatus Woesearchaeota archaeon]